MAVYSERKIHQISYPWGENSPIIPAIRKERRPSPTESPLLFEVDPKPIKETLTAFGGIPLVVQAFRSRGLPEAGTIELLHDILKNDWGAGVLRSKYIGANVRPGYPWR